MKKTMALLSLALLLVLAACSTPKEEVEEAPESTVTPTEAMVSEEAVDPQMEEEMAYEEYTLDELAKYNGKDGMPAYIAIDGLIYDVSETPQWMEESHGGSMADTDISEAFKT